MFFKLDINLRIQIQREIFGGSSLNKGDVTAGNQRFYYWCWQNIQHFNKCQNCFHLLPGYAATFVSHILSRQNRPEIAHDPRNANILCADCHKMWESPKNKIMAIYRQNQYIITLLNQEYRLS
jgi:hypothetical protein